MYKKNNVNGVVVDSFMNVLEIGVLLVFVVILFSCVCLWYFSRVIIKLNNVVIKNFILCLLLKF